MAQRKVTQRTLKKIDGLVSLYEEKQSDFEQFADAVHRLLDKHPLLKPYLHSVKSRTKDPDHLRKKLVRKAQDAVDDDRDFDITKENLFDRITDLSGVRLLHLHSDQFSHIHDALMQIFKEQIYVLNESVANTWDHEFGRFFEQLGIETKVREDMYTSVHYIILANTKSQTPCEIQVRTLFEEVWGEVSHKVDYPTRSESVACREQIKVLARITSSGTRLVDSIFRSLDEYSSLTSSDRDE